MVELRRISVSSLARAMALGLSLAFLVLGTACEEKHTFVAPPAPKVTVVQPIYKTITVNREFTGNTQAINSVQLVARVEGYLEKVLFQDGERVKKGQPLFVIQQDTYQAKVQQAEATLATTKAKLDYAEGEFARYTQLFKQNAAAATDVTNWKFQRDSARASVSSSEADLVLAKLNLSYTRVAAPFDGHIDRRLVDPGNLVGVGGNTALANVNQIDPIYVYFTINENDLLDVIARLKKEGTFARNPTRKIYMALAKDEGFPHEGHLDFASISLSAQSGTLLLRGIFPNPDYSILPGMFAHIMIPYEEVGKAMVVPDVGLGTDQLGHFLLVVNDKNVVERRGVEVGPQEDKLIVVEKGLKGDEWVIINGLLDAIPGREVNPTRTTIPEATPAPKASKGS